MKKTLFKILLLFVLLVASEYSFAQNNIVLSSEDSIALKHDPKKAVLFSIVPGGGQIYNKKYWKVPVLYAGLGTLTYFAVWNQKNYKIFKDALIARTDTDTSTTDEFPVYSVEDLTIRKDYYRRNRDLCFLGLGTLYALQMIDAYVDAHLFTFNVDDNLTLNWSPVINMNAQNKTSASVYLCLKF